MTNRQISKKLGIPLRTIQRIIRNYNNSGTPSRKIGSGRHTILDENDLDIIKKMPSRQEGISLRKMSNEIKNKTKKNFSHNTLERFIKKNDGKISNFVKKPFLTKNHKLKRLIWSKECLFRGKLFWENMIFSDESMFTMYNEAKNKTMWKFSNEPSPISRTKKYGFKKIMVWGCFSKNGTGNLVFVDSKMNSIKYIELLANNLFESSKKMNLKKFKFQQDNASVHVSKLTKEFFDFRKIDVISWPAQSPDLNPIENLWAIMKKKLELKNFENIDKLKVEILKIWDEVDKKICENLVSSMTKRINLCIANKGDFIKY